MKPGKSAAAELRTATRATRLTAGAALLAAITVMAFPRYVRARDRDNPTPPKAAPARRAAVAADPDAPARAAMLSIYWYARFLDAEALPERVRPMPLEAAARRVREHATNPVGESRRRRAIAKLYAGERTAERLRALQVLNAPLAVLDSRIPPLPAETPPPDPSVVEQQAIVVMEEALGASIPGCKRTAPDSQVKTDIVSWNINAKATISVQRDLAALAPVLDPQNWDVCGGQFWKAAYITLDSGNSPKPDPAAPTPGTMWKGMLFEHFVYEVGWFDLSSFEVLLDIDSSSTPAKTTATYGLHKSLRSRVGPIEKAGGIVEDSGSVTAVVAGDPTWSDITVTKKLRLEFWKNSADFFLNFWGGVALEVASDDLYEGVCCQP